MKLIILNFLLDTVDDEVQEHLEKAKADKVIEEVVRKIMHFNNINLL